MKLQLVSFKLCPFVQRSVIVLNEKKVSCDITYIDLQNPPGWFTELSPLGKVPLLRVGDTVLFESAVIMEYLDEIHPPSLHPQDPLRKAHNRAWIEFSSSLLFQQYRLITAKEKGEFTEILAGLKTELARVEPQVVGPFFNDADFSLADAAFAPLFMRARLIEQQLPLGLFDGLPRLAAWRDELLERPAVGRSVVPEFPDLFRGMIKGQGGFFAQLMEAGG